MDDYFDFGSGDDFDVSSFLNDGGSSGVDLSGIDFGPEAFDISSLLGDESGLADMGLTGVGSLADLNFDEADLSGIDLSQLGEMGLTGVDLADILKTEGGVEALSRSLASSNEDTSGGVGLRATGRGQLSAFDPETGATGITGEGFKSIEDLLGAGTAEEIARYTPGSADYSLRSGLETEDGQGLSADSTRGMSLDSMGGGQGLSKYIPAQYFEGETTPIKGTGGTLSETGFLSQSSAANPLGSKYSLGEPKSFINNPTITGQQSVVSPGRTIIDNKDGTYKVVTNTVDGGTKTITTTKDGVDKIIRETKTIDNTKVNAGAKAAAADKKDNNMLLMLLALMAMMNKGGGSSSSNAVIPSLAANRSQLPYGPISGSTARPGAGGVTYFSPTTYSPKAAGGGLMSLAGGGVTKMAIGGPTKAALEQAYAAQDYDTVNKLVSQNQITDADVRGTWGMDTSGLSGMGINLYQPPAIPNNNALNAQANPVDTEIFDYFTKNQNLVQNKDYNTIASDMYTSGWTPDMVARATGTDAKSVGDLYNQTYGAFDRAKQEDLVNQKYKKQLGLTDEQLGQRDFGAAMDTRENRLASAPFSNAYEKYQEELAATGRRDAPVGSQFRAKAVYMPDSIGNRGSIQLIDSATGQQLTNFGANDIGNTRNAFELLDKFGVDPASYRNAASQMYESLGKPIYMQDDYDYLTKYKPRDVSGKTDTYLTKPLASATSADLKPRYEKDDNARQTADSKTNVFYEVPMTKLLQSKGLTSTEASNLLGQLRPVAGLVNFAEITRSKDPVKALIGTLNYLQSKGLTNRRFASGGISSLGAASQMSDLGGYSDGGRLLKGPGDGVSDSIPATIGGKQPARLAEGEFVVPARIVSELGNGSTEAGAQKLYAMMDRVQKARRKTKNVAADTKAHKYLPA